MSIVLIDISNTHTKLVVVEPTQSSQILPLYKNELAFQIVETSQISSDNLQHYCDLLEQSSNSSIEQAWVSSVVPDKSAIIQSFFESNDIVVQFINHQTVKDLVIDYPKPSEIGADRLANAVAAKYFYPSPAIVLDFGTAITFDILDEQGSYIGGIIAPGIQMMKHYFCDKTALLPEMQLDELKQTPQSIIGRSTQEAMQIGTLTGHVGLVGHLLDKLKAEYENTGGNPPTIIACGGDAELICQHFQEIIIHPRLTLDGLLLNFS